MMNDSFPARLVPAVVLVVTLATISMTGCGVFGDSEPETINDDAPERSVVTEKIFDEEVELIDDYSDTIEVEVPDEVLSLAINVTDGPETRNHFVTNWVDEEGFQIVRDGWEEGTGEICWPDCNNRVIRGVGAFGGLAPNNPDSVDGVTPGTHKFEVGTAASQTMGLGETSTAQTANTVRVTVYAEVVYDEVPETGTIDLNLFFSGAQGWTAEDAPDDPDVQELISEMDKIYDQIGVDIGDISYYEVDEDYQDIQDLFSGNGDLSRMFAESERGELEGPSIFFVERLHHPLGGAGGVLGISGGIPGPMILKGTPRSGVAIALDSAQGFGSGAAKVTAHELGHFLGLFHTSEHQSGFGTPEHDPLPDTTEHNQSYLMHAGGTGDEMSEWQGRVIRTNPWVYHD